MVTGRAARLDAIAVAGGFTPRADKSEVQLTRSVGGDHPCRHGRAQRSGRPGDTLYVRERLL